MADHKSEPAIKTEGLTKIFRDFWGHKRVIAIDSLDLEVRKHEVYGLLGPNGSGKSTIIKLILGLLHKTSGRLSVFGKPPSDVIVKKYIGFLPEESYLYRYLNSRETLDYYGKLFGLEGRTRRQRIDDLLDMVGLTQVAHRPVGEFSKGMMRRIGLAQALINDPDFLILDEPTSGLDPIGTRQVKDLILELGRRGKTILLSSHLLADVEDVCDRMVMLYGGKIRAEGTAESLLSDTEHTIIETPRLQEDTISRVEQVIQECEGLAIEKIHTPRQRLEHFFLEVVEQARLEQITTSGAMHGGETAAFLRADSDEGDHLIESLMSEQPADAPQSVEVTHDDALPEPTKDVLEELLDQDEKPPVPKTREVRSTPSPQAPRDVDSSVIDSLVDGDGSDDQQSDKTGTSE